MTESDAKILAGYLTVDSRIAKAERELGELRKEKERAEFLLREMKGGSDERRFKVAYSHLVQGMSLTACAKKYHYTRDSVCKIIRKYRDKLT